MLLRFSLLSRQSALAAISLLDAVAADKNNRFHNPNREGLTGGNVAAAGKKGGRESE